MATKRQFKKKKKQDHTGKQYDNKKHIKFKQQPEDITKRNPRAAELQKKLDDAQESSQKAQIEPMSAIQEKYAHDLVVLSMMFSIVKNVADAKKDTQVEDARKELENIKHADANSQKNKALYNEFKQTFKELKIVETKTKDTNNSKSDLKRLQKMEENLKKELEKKVKAFDFVDQESKNQLKFETIDEFLAFSKASEEQYFAYDYRLDIDDDEEISDIFETPISKLGELAEKTYNRDSKQTLDAAKAVIDKELAQQKQKAEQEQSQTTGYAKL